MRRAASRPGRGSTIERRARSDAGRARRPETAARDRAAWRAAAQRRRTGERARPRAARDESAFAHAEARRVGRGRASGVRRARANLSIEGRRDGGTQAMARRDRGVVVATTRELQGACRGGPVSGAAVIVAQTWEERRGGEGVVRGGR